MALSRAGSEEVQFKQSSQSLCLADICLPAVRRRHSLVESEVSLVEPGRSGIMKISQGSSGNTACLGYIHSLRDGRRRLPVGSGRQE